MAVWFKKSGAKTFNAHCKNTVFRCPNGKRDIHPTQKNIELLKQLIADNTNEGDSVFDPCSGSGTSEIAAIQLNRKYIGFEMDTQYYANAKRRITESIEENKAQIRMVI